MGCYCTTRSRTDTFAAALALLVTIQFATILRHDAVFAPVANVISAAACGVGTLAVYFAIATTALGMTTSLLLGQYTSVAGSRSRCCWASTLLLLGPFPRQRRCCWVSAFCCWFPFPLLGSVHFFCWFPFPFPRPA